MEINVIEEDPTYANKSNRDDATEEQNAEDHRVYKCGWWCFTPAVLNMFLTPKWVLFWFCWAGAIQGMLVNGFVNVVITTIEKRYGLSSAQTGLIVGAYDIASFLLLVPVSYLGGRKGASKPRWVGVGYLLMGIGAAAFTLPHFLAGTYKASTTYSSLCQRVGDLSHFQMCEKNMDNLDGIKSSTAMWLFFIGQFLHGAGCAPLFTLGVTFIDENVSKKMSSVYIGIYYTTAIIGPALGYVLGGEILKVYVDFPTVDPSTLGLTQSSSVWVGAWWIGFLIAALLSIIVAIAILAFPLTLPGSEELQKQRTSEAHGNAGIKAHTAFTKIREIPLAFYALVSNPTFVFLNMAGASEGLLIDGFAAFLPKFIENQFGVGAATAAIVMGLITVPAGGGGTYLGGYLVKKLKMKCSGIIKFCVYVTIFTISLTFSFLIACPNMSFAGVNHYYKSERNHIGYPQLDSTCNTRCSCSKFAYDPICGADNVMYYSPCFAGCEEEHSTNESKIYSKCSCIDSGKQFDYDAVNSVCDNGCNRLWGFVAFSLLSFFLTFLNTMPALSATLRSVKDHQRSFALGIQWIKVRLLGTIPAPMIFGLLIDKTCTLWYDACGDRGACLQYNNLNMSRYMMGIALIGKGLSLMFFFFAWLFYVPPPLDDTLEMEVEMTTF